MFKQKFALSQKETEKTSSLVSFLELLPRICDATHYQSIDDEWRRLPFYQFDEEMLNLEVDVFERRLFQLKNEGGEHLFHNLAQCALRALSLPHANADSERLFFKLNLTKPETRNKLREESVPKLRGILLASQQTVKVTLTSSPPKICSGMTTNSLYIQIKNQDEKGTEADVNNKEEFNGVEEVLLNL